jgi:hypothetical protein
MSNMLSGRPDGQGTCAWPLELDLKVGAAARCWVTGERLRSLARLLNEVDGISQASAAAHKQTNLVRLRLVVDAYDLFDAFDRASGLVRDCATCVGLGPTILVAARQVAATPGTGRRMG